MKLIKLLPVAFVSLSILACKKQVTIIQTAPVAESQRTELQQGGTDSTGGGNGIQGKPLDDYILNIRELPAFTNHIKPLIQDLSQNYPELAADFYHLSIERDWYFVPTDLDQIAKNILGVYARTDQIALQDLNKIMVDSQLFAQMQEHDQAVLIAHEIVMGIRLLKHKKTQDLCMATAARTLVSENNYPKYENLKKKCRETYPFIPGTQNEKFSLNSDDYDFIRKLVKKITVPVINYAELKSLIEDNQFRDYKKD